MKGSLLRSVSLALNFWLLFLFVFVYIALHYQIKKQVVWRAYLCVSILIKISNRLYIYIYCRCEAL